MPGPQDYYAAVQQLAAEVAADAAAAAANAPKPTPAPQLPPARSFAPGGLVSPPVMSPGELVVVEFTPGPSSINAAPLPGPGIVSQAS